MQRIHFQEAIEDENLLKLAFEDLTWPARTLLKAFYGCELSQNVHNPITGWSELDYWALTQGSCEYDELGFVTKITPIPYVAAEYDELWAIIGRRAGKTSGLQSFILAYEATLGGHEEYVANGQEFKMFLLAQQKDIATANLPFIENIIKTSPILESTYLGQVGNELRFKNGLVIESGASTIKAQRGLAIPVVGLDEVSFWYKDADSANPDFQVLSGIRKAQMQFPHKKRIGISSPWSKQGILYEAHQAGTGGSKVAPEKTRIRKKYRKSLVAFGTTASWENPLMTREAVVDELEGDPDGFPTECLCIFPDSVSGFLSRELIEKAIEKGQGTAERPMKESKGNMLKTTYHYVAAMDPAFRNDSFTFCIVHSEAGNIVLDLIRQWIPAKGRKVNPTEVLEEIKPLMDAYQTSIIYSDQYQLESLQQLAMKYDLMVEGVDFTARSKAKVFGNLQQLINQQKLVLLDADICEPMAMMREELVWLEKRLLPQGGMQFSAPEGKHDDLAVVLALACFKAAWMTPVESQEEVEREPTVYEKIMAQIARKAAIEHSGY